MTYSKEVFLCAKKLRFCLFSLPSWFLGSRSRAQPFSTNESFLHVRSPAIRLEPNWKATWWMFHDVSCSSTSVSTKNSKCSTSQLSIRALRLEVAETTLRHVTGPSSPSRATSPGSQGPQRQGWSHDLMPVRSQPCYEKNTLLCCFTGYMIYIYIYIYIMIYNEI